MQEEKGTKNWKERKGNKKLKQKEKGWDRKKGHQLNHKETTPKNSVEIVETTKEHNSGKPFQIWSLVKDLEDSSKDRIQEYENKGWFSRSNWIVRASTMCSLLQK